MSLDVFGFAARHRLALQAFACALFLAGLFAGFGLPVGLFPNVTFPRVVVEVDVGELPGNQVLLAATRPLEDALSSVPGLVSLRTTTSRGAAELAANFGWDVDMTLVMTLVESRVNQARASLPPGATSTVRRMDPTSFPVAGFSLTSDARGQTELRDLAQFTLRPLLLQAAGTASVALQGGDASELLVQLDPLALRARGLSPQAVSAAIAKGNLLGDAGLLATPYRLYQALTDGRTGDPTAIARLPLSTDARGQSVLIGDVANVSAATAPRFTRTAADGHEAVLLNVYQQPGGSTVSLDVGLKQAVQEASKHLPADVHLSQFYDQAALIRAAMASVRDSILIGIALGIGVIWLFLRKAKLTLLAALAVPTTLGITLLVLDRLHMGFNVMTLGGLAAAVGLVLDDAIVLLENVARHLQRAPAAGTEAAARAATNELVVPFVGSSLCSIVVFTPLAFLAGVSGAFFRSLSLTMAAALAVSLLFSLFVLPPLAGRFLTARDAEHEERGPGWLGRVYARTLGGLLTRPWLAIATSLALSAATVALYFTLPNGFLPTMDEGSFILDFTTAPGTSLGESERILGQVEAVIHKTPEVASYSRRTGTQLGGALTEPNQGDYMIRLKPDRQRDIDAVMEDVRGQVEGSVPGVRIELAQLMEDLIGDLTAVPQPVEVQVQGPDLATDQGVARQIAAVLPTVTGVVDVFDGITVSGPTLRAVVDLPRAARYGVSATDVNDALELAIGGHVAGSVLAGQKQVDVRVRLGEPGALTPDALGAVPVALPGGQSVALAKVAHVVEDPGTTEITRQNLQQMVAVTARIEGASLGGTVDKVREAVARKVKLPDNVSLTYGGLYAEQQASFRGLLGVIAAALVLVTLVLLFEFGAWRVPVAILIVDVLALFGVLAALAVTGTPLNVSSLMGAVMIVGIVSENSVFFVHYVQEYEREGLSLDAALLEAGRVRARPVLMTTLAAILALAPLALGLGAGAQLQRPLAIAVIGGFALSSLLILLALPTFYRLFSRTSRKVPA